MKALRLLSSALLLAALSGQALADAASHAANAEQFLKLARADKLTVPVYAQVQQMFAQGFAQAKAPEAKKAVLERYQAKANAELDKAVGWPVLKPELVKPNLTEINGLLGTSFTTDDVDELRAALASDARFSDIPWVVVSMGAAGSVGFHNGRAFRAKTPDIPAVNATGSGDSTIAGFAHAIAAGADDETVLRTANTCGKLNAMDPMTGHLVMDRWDEVYNGVVVTEL